MRQVPKRKLYFDPMSLLISEDHYHKFDWEEFYQDAREAIQDDMPHSRGKPIPAHCFEYAENASEKVTR